MRKSLYCIILGLILWQAGSFLIDVFALFSPGLNTSHPYSLFNFFEEITNAESSIPFLYLISRFSVNVAGIGLLIYGIIMYIHGKQKERTVSKKFDSEHKPRGINILVKWYVVIGILTGLYVMFLYYAPSVQELIIQNQKFLGIFDYNKDLLFLVESAHALAPIALALIISKPLWYGRFAVIGFEGLEIAGSIPALVYMPSINLISFGTILPLMAISVLIIIYMNKSHVKSYFAKKPSLDTTTYFTNV
jgi:hypothetical protein